MAVEKHQQAYENARNAPRSSELKAELERLRRNDQTAQVRATIETSLYPKVERLGEGNTNQTYKLSNNDHSVVYKPESGQRRSKERAGIDPLKQWQREIGASIVSEELGISLVPPTAKVYSMNDVGSGQYFEKGMIKGADAQKPPFNLKLVEGKAFPAQLPPRVAEEWQLVDDLLMQGDRHLGNYMVQLDAQGKVMNVALIDNGNSLTANPAVLRKRFDGPCEGQWISQLNMERLQQLIDNEQAVTKRLSEYLESPAIAGLFARAKALLARGIYGRFELAEINAHLPPGMRGSAPVQFDDIRK